MIKRTKGLTQEILLEKFSFYEKAWKQFVEWLVDRLGGWCRVMDMEGNLTFSFDTAVLVTSRQKS